VTECQGCGAWNDTSRTLCVLCGTPLAETDEWDAAAELPPLPPLPDGGLAASMPSWLRAPPPTGATGTLPSGRVSPAAPSPDLAPLGPTADPRTFLVDDDFPRWLRDLAARRAPVPGNDAVLPAAAALQAPAAWPNWPEAAAAANPVIPPPAPVPALPMPSAPTGNEGRPPPALVAAREREERRGRGAWETLLLVLLFIGVVAAAIWALVSNGVFSPGL